MSSNSLEKRDLRRFGKGSPVAGEHIGLEEVGDTMWNIVYYNAVLGRIDLQTGKITGGDIV
jgi:hypothetical protein